MGDRRWLLAPAACSLASSASSAPGTTATCCSRESTCVPPAVICCSCTAGACWSAAVGAAAAGAQLPLLWLQGHALKLSEAGSVCVCGDLIGVAGLGTGGGWSVELPKRAACSAELYAAAEEGGRRGVWIRGGRGRRLCLCGGGLFV